MNLNPVHDVGCGISTAAGDAATSVFDDVAKEFATLAEHATAWVWQQLDGATAVKLSGARWNGVLQVTVELGVLVCVLMLLLQVIACALRQDFGGLSRGVRGVMIAMLGTFASFVITDSLLSAVDSLSTGVMQALAGTTAWTNFGNQVIHANTLTSGAIGSAGMLLCAFVMLLSSLVVWLALMVRKMLVIIGAAFAPIAFGGAPFDVTSAWVRKWIEFTIALVFSKLVLVILFGIGLQIELGLGNVGNSVTQQITQMLTGLLVMSVAGFAPWLALQFVHWAGGGMQNIQHHASATHAGGQAAIAAPQRLYAGGKAIGTAGAAGIGAAAGKLSDMTKGASNGGDSSGSDSGSSPSTSSSNTTNGNGSGSSSGGGATGAAESAYESGKNQTAQALSQNAGGSGSGGGQDNQQQSSQSSQSRQPRQDSGSQDGAGTGSETGSGGQTGSGQPTPPSRGSDSGDGPSSPGSSGGGGSGSRPSGPPLSPGGGRSGGGGGGGAGMPKPGGSPGGEPSGPGGGGAGAGGAEIAAA